MSGPLPQYRPNFPPDFLAEAQRLARQRTCPAHLLQRARLVLLLDQQPLLSNVAAAACSGVHPNSIRLWRARWAEGRFSLADEAGRGRKPTFSPPRPRRRQGHGLRGRRPDRKPAEPPVPG